MISRARTVLSALAVLLFCLSLANAQAQQRPAFAQRELDQMLAPIALYPDALLAQILMAATYPGEVVEAAQWSRRNSDLNGDRAVRAVERIDWDASVKSLVAFPQILGMMDEKIGWTEDLGDAFLDQQAQVMDTVQYLRRKAYTAGNLASTDQFRVDFQGASVLIELSNPEIVYMPYYNPAVVYGAWWWPSHQPVVWAPWPGYFARPGYARSYAWGPGIPVSRGFFYSAPDWHRRSVTIVNVNNYYYSAVPAHRAYRPPEIAVNVNAPRGAPAVWQHDIARRRDMPHHNAAWRQPAAPASQAAAAPDVRREFRERESAVTQSRGAVGPVMVPKVAALPEVRSATSQSPVPVSVAGAAVEPRATTVNASQGGARRHDAAPFAGHSGSGRRGEFRGESASHRGDRGNSQPIVAGITPRPAIERAPPATPAPPVANPPAISRETQSPPQAAASRGHADQRPNAITSGPAVAGHRADGTHASTREHAARQAPAATGPTVAAGNTPGAAAAPQSGGNSSGNAGILRRPQ